MKFKETFLKILIECSRLLIGVVFIFSGAVKAVDPVGGAIKIVDYLEAFSLGILEPLSTLLSINLSAIEFALGVCVLLGVYRKYSTLLTLIFMAFMTPLTLYLALFDPVSDCGCFGDAIVISNWETFYKNIVLLAASIILFIYNQKIFRVYTFRVYWFVALFAYMFCVGFSYYNYNHLPLIDFRPYKVGANIPELMSIPEGAPEDEYEYSFVYEKDGVTKELSLEELSSIDSTWTFVDSKTKLIKEGFHPVIEAFHLFDPGHNDISEQILDNSEGVFLLIAPRLEKADDERIDEINNLYDYAFANNILFYGVTGSSSDEIQKWTERTGAEYPFLFADDVLLKTIIRSNPGLVLLKNGTILAKWHYKDIPQEEDLKRVMGDYLSDTHIKKKGDRGLMGILLSFILPLLLVWVYDYFRNRRRKADKQ